VVEFGRFDFASGGFVPETMPVAPPQAVRVTANKLGANSFQGLGGAPVAADANSVALLRCRNVVFVQDVSSSFREDIGKVQDALRQAVAILELQGGFGGVETRVGLVAFRNIVVPAGSTDTLLSPSDTRIDDAIEALDDPTVLCGTPMMERGNTIIVPACVGSDMRAGLVEARRLLQPGNGKNAACEDLVLTVSDGVPCKILEENLDDSLPLFARFFGFDVVFGPALPGEPQGGGSTAAETLAFVNANMRSTGSIAVLTANSNQPTNPDPDDLNSFLGTCPTANTSTSQQTVNEDFANQLITGFGQPFASTKTAEAMAAELIAAMQTIPPVVVR
jgi:hypothetical protein